MVEKKRQVEIPFVAKASGFSKLIMSVTLAIVAFFVISIFKIDLMSSIILSWDVFCISMIALCWTLFFTTRSESLESVVMRQDDDHKLIFLIVLIAVCFSVFGTLALMTQDNEGSFSKIAQTVVSLSPVFLSWFLLHSIFTIRYAHLFHGGETGKKTTDAGKIDFPDKSIPDYIDFAYFSFVIGMTFQVSDVQVKSKDIRRVVLMHSLISFAFNTIIVALSINTIGNLGK